MATSAYITTVGTIGPRGKIHRAHGHPARQVTNCCYAPTSTTITELPGGVATTKILLAHDVDPDRLCGRCFLPRFRVEYTAEFNASHRMRFIPTAEED